MLKTILRIETIEKCLEVLNKGGVILYPTDTIWGLGCDATNAEAIEKIYSIKNRPAEKSMIVLVNDDNMLYKYVKKIPDLAWDILDNTEKPTTIIYDEVIGLPDVLLATDKSCGIRICKDDFCNELIKRFKKPIVSTSANLSGLPSPQNFSDIREEVKIKADYIVTLRQNEIVKSVASTVIKLSNNGEIKIVRK